jgi:hypothetical protein
MHRAISPPAQIMLCTTCWIVSFHQPSPQQGDHTELKIRQNTEQIFIKRRYINGQQVYENMLASLIREMQTKTTIRYHLLPLRMVIIKKVRNNKHWQGYGERGILMPCLWECKLVLPL